MLSYRKHYENENTYIKMREEIKQMRKTVDRITLYSVVYCKCTPTGIQVQASELEQQDSITETNALEEDVTEEDSEEDINIGKDDIGETE